LSNPELKLETYLPRLALNCDPPDLCFQSSQDYRHEVPFLASPAVF
jgi:hypothetical protein